MYDKEWEVLTLRKNLPPPKLPQNKVRRLVAPCEARDNHIYFLGDEEVHGCTYDGVVFILFCLHFLITETGRKIVFYYFLHPKFHQFPLLWHTVQSLEGSSYQRFPQKVLETGYETISKQEREIFAPGGRGHLFCFMMLLPVYSSVLYSKNFSYNDGYGKSLEEGPSNVTKERVDVQWKVWTGTITC